MRDSQERLAVRRVILGELGRPEAELQRLMAAGVVSESRSREYLPS